MTRRWINIYDEDELHYWERLLVVDRKELLQAVRAVGANPSEVKKWLRETAQPAGPEQLAA